MEEKTEIKRITFTSRKGGRRTLDKAGNEINKQKEVKEQKGKGAGGKSSAPTDTENQKSEDKKTDKDN